MRLRSSVAFSSMVAAASAAAGATQLSSRAALLLPAAVHAACSHEHHTSASRCGNMNLSQTLWVGSIACSSHRAHMFLSKGFKWDADDEVSMMA